MDIVELRKFKPQIELLAKNNKASNVRVFGSVARGEQNLTSDVDLLVTLSPKASLLDLGGLLEDLKDLLKCRVDVVSDDSIHSYIRENILKEAISL
ncbi:MAG: nucleotidyltransferase domain-containing protein [Pseudomonadota bacterium]